MTDIVSQAGDVKNVSSKRVIDFLQQVRVFLSGTVDIVRLRSIWHEILNEHKGYYVRCHSSQTAGSDLTDLLRRVPWQEHDLRNIPESAVNQWLTLFLEADRNQEIPLDRVPLMRCAVLRHSDLSCEILWSYHSALFEEGEASRFLDEILRKYNGSSAQANSSPELLISQVLFSEGRALGPLKARDLAAVSARPVILTLPATQVSEGPRDDVERGLLEIWQDVLHKSPIGMRDDFFEMGGHSLLAAKLLARIEEKFSKTLPFASLLEMPNIEQQAKLLRGDRSVTVPAGLKKQDPDHRGYPFFLFGDSPTFRALARALGAAGPVHNLGLQPSLIGHLNDPYSLKCMAEHFVREMRERQPVGPYFLGGWCAHGLLAFETAQQLRAQGQQIGLLILIETVQPVRRLEYPAWKRLIATYQLKMYLAKFEFRYLGGLDRSRRIDYVAGRVIQKLSRVKRALLRRLGANGSSNSLDSRDPLSVLYAAAGQYKPSPYEGPVALFRSLKRTFGFGQELLLGWNNMLGQQLEVHEVPGTHYTIYIEPHVQTLAAKMISALQKSKDRVAAGGKSLRAAG